MAFVEKQLGQAQGTSTAVPVYSPAQNVRGIVKNVTLCNTTGSDVTFSVFADDDGTTYDETTAKFFNNVLKAGKTLDWDTFWPLSKATGSVGFKGAGITITLDGAEITNN